MLSFRNVPNFARPRKRGPSEYRHFDRLLRVLGKSLSGIRALTV
jgi:hypothetical protein